MTATRQGRSAPGVRAGAPARGGRHRKRIALVGGLAVLAAVAVAVAVSVGRSAGPADSSGASVSRAGLSPVEGVPGVVHVHGLAVAPRDGALYAATHLGLFRIPADGPPNLVANRYQDTMGFTISADGEFLGSGHPDLREDLPPLLGLISSPDQGATWRSESLLGKADFHALRTGGGVLYGYDSTGMRLLASTDRRRWETRSVEELADFAVAPTNADQLIAVGRQGVVRSRDGGRHFAPAPGTPALALLDWATDAIYGVDAAGRVHVSTDGGTTWAARGSTGGRPEAMTVSGPDVYVAVEDRGILASHDGGTTFTVRYRDASLGGAAR